MFLTGTIFSFQGSIFLCNWNALYSTYSHIHGALLAKAPYILDWFVRSTIINLYSWEDYTADVTTVMLRLFSLLVYLNWLQDKRSLSMFPCIHWLNFRLFHTLQLSHHQKAVAAGSPPKQIAGMVFMLMQCLQNYCGAYHHGLFVHLLQYVKYSLAITGSFHMFLRYLVLYQSQDAACSFSPCLYILFYIYLYVYSHVLLLGPSLVPVFHRE